jgi:hypothetical protein
MKNLLLFLLFFPITIWAQKVCGSDEYNKSLMVDNKIHYEKIEENLNKWIKSYSRTKDLPPQQYTIPVVFHIVWHDSIENLHDSIIHQQLQVLNRDFNLLNSDTTILTDTLKNLPGNFRLTFELATLDPNGAFTTGITRHYTPNTSFSYFDNAIKNSLIGGVDPWPPKLYMNIWVGDLSAGLLGYSQFPGGPILTDGNVIDYAVTGNQMYHWTYGPQYAGGRVLVHEIGHWLNLFHPWWGNDASWCGNDEVDDTGLQDGPNVPAGGCPDTTFSNCNPSERENVKIYMDYCGDSCMVMFTKGQVERGLASLHTYRPQMINQGTTTEIIEENIQRQLDIKIYPTVTKGRVYIEMPKDIIINGITQVLVVDMMGKVVEMETIHQEKNLTLFLYKLSNGTYSINLINGGYTIHSSKIIISKSSIYGGKVEKEDFKKVLEDKK